MNVILRNRAVQWTSLMVFVGLILLTFIQGDLGLIGPDSDDKMRLVQIRDVLGGQSWFDLHQYRMGPEPGTLMHWSRLVDLPYLILISGLDVFLPYVMAEKTAISLVPPIYAVGIIGAMSIAMQHIGGRNSIGFACLIMALYLVMNIRFEPGAIDHHNLQFLLLVTCVAFLIDPENRKRSFIIAGMCAAISVAIGPEVYLFIAIICGYVALAWLVRGDRMQGGTMGFGIAFAVTLILVFIATTAPSNYMAVYCDALSFITVTAGAIGGLGLALVAVKFSDANVKARIIALSVLGLMCLACLGWTAPHCLANPLADLPDDVKDLWLGRVSEAEPLFKDRKTWFINPPYAIGMGILALIVAGHQIRSGKFRGQYSLLVALICAAILLTLHQIRFQFFVHFMAFFVIIPWVARVYTQGKDRSDGSVLYILPLALSLPFLWGTPGLLAKPQNKDVTTQKRNAGACFSNRVMDAYNDLSTGRVAVTSNGTSRLLLRTSHSALSGNYHRNVKGIEQTLTLFMSEPDKALTDLQDNKIDYLHFCKASGETRLLAKQDADGLMAALVDGNVPDYLEPLRENLEDGNVTIYKVVAP